MRRISVLSGLASLLAGVVLSGATGTTLPAAAASPPTVSIGNGEGDESVGGQPGRIRLPVTLSDPSTSTVTVDWAFVPTGEPGAATTDDVIKTSGTVTFKPSARTGLTATTKYVTVRAVADAVFEGPQQFTVELSNPSSGYTLGRNPGFGLIGEPTGSQYVTARSAAIVEGDTGTKNTLKVPIVLGGPMAVPVSVDIVVTGGNATPDLDYKAIKPKTLTFKPGQVRKNLGIAVTPEAVAEPLEEISFALTNPTGGALIGTPTFTVSIFDDDGPSSAGGLVVDTVADTHDAAPGDGFCADANGACSLRAAVDELNAAPPTPAVIELDSDAVLSIAGANDDLNVSGDIDIRVPDVEIRGNHHTINAAGIDRALHATGNLTLSEILIRNGDAPEIGATRQTFGGGIWAPDGAVTGHDVRLLNNSASGQYPASCSPLCPDIPFGSGGGVRARDVSLTDSYLSANVAGQSGGAVDATSSATVDRSTVTSNMAGGPGGFGTGGGIRSSSVIVRDSDIGWNTAVGSNDASWGGGIKSEAGLTLERSLVRYNEAPTGGGVYAGATADDRITDSTFSGNRGDGAAIAFRKCCFTQTPTIERSTFVGNADGPTISLGALVFCGPIGCPLPPPPTLTIEGSIISPSTPWPACAVPPPDPNLQFGWIGTFVDGGHNLISDGGACTFGSTADPLLGPLADNGGPTWTHLPQPGSPAIDGGGACTGVDQRGVTRPRGAACDIGSVEVVSSEVVVNTTGDTHDVAPGDGVCDDGTGACSLRAAIDEINVGSAPRVIELEVSPRLSLTGVDDDMNASGDIDIRVSDVEIRGNGHTIDARGIDRVLDASASGGAGLTVLETTITGGRVTATSAAGGGIRARGLTVVDSTVTANFAGAGGGGISAEGLDVVDSTISENATYTGFPPLFGAGGGISASAPVRISGATIAANDASIGGGLNASGDIEVDNTTFSANHATLTGSGAALRQFFTALGPRLTNTTFVGNTGSATIEFSAPTCPSGPACPPPPGVLTITRSIIVSPTAPACSLGTFDHPSSQSVVDGGSNLISNGGACAFGSPADPLLGPLADNGGPTWTHLPQPGSPAIDGGGACTGVDQRGLTRPRGAACDIGSVEV